MTAIGAFTSGVVSQSVGTSAAGAAVSTASLEGDILSCQKQLADLVTCPSAKTPQGKAAIASLSARISAARASVEQRRGAKPVSGANAAAAAGSARVSQSASGVSAIVRAATTALTVPGATARAATRLDTWA